MALVLEIPLLQSNRITAMHNAALDYGCIDADVRLVVLDGCS
jgi:hypothetical protein